MFIIAEADDIRVAEVTIFGPFKELDFLLIGTGAHPIDACHGLAFRRSYAAEIATGAFLLRLDLLDKQPSGPCSISPFVKQ